MHFVYKQGVILAWHSVQYSSFRTRIMRLLFLGLFLPSEKYENYNTRFASLLRNFSPVINWSSSYIPISAIPKCTNSALLDPTARPPRHVQVAFYIIQYVVTAMHKWTEISECIVGRSYENIYVKDEVINCAGWRIKKWTRRKVESPKLTVPQLGQMVPSMAS